MRRIGILVAALLPLAACGGSGKGATTPSTVQPDRPGVRSVPVGTLTVTRASALVAGEPVTLRVHLDQPAGAPPPASVGLWIGGAYDPPSQTTLATAIGGGDYAASVSLPSELPSDAAAWVRVTLSDGSLCEAGRGAFELATLPAATP